ncbi:MAG: hypothetical protein ACE5HA_17850 [Anaerolineae bacterium]
MDRGCGASYGIGRPIRVYMRVQTAGRYSLTVSTAWGNRALWSAYLWPGYTYYVNGRVSEPTGAHTLTLYDAYWNPTSNCTFHASYYGHSNSADEAADDVTVDILAEQPPDVKLLEEVKPEDVVESEW